MFQLLPGISTTGIVVGGSDDLRGGVRRVFLRLLNGSVLELAPAQGDAHSQAEAVCDVFTNLGNRFVYVVGLTFNGAFVETRGARWTVNVDTGAVVDPTVLSLQDAVGVNGAGDVAGNRAPAHPNGSQSATLFQGGSYITLAPPKGGRRGFSRGLARTALSPTYVVGEARMGRFCKR